MRCFYTYSISIPFLGNAMSKVTGVVLGALTGHFIMLTELCLVRICEILELFLGGDTC